jgi:hypothetical protein
MMKLNRWLTYYTLKSPIACRMAPQAVHGKVAFNYRSIELSLRHCLAFSLHKLYGL